MKCGIKKVLNERRDAKIASVWGGEVLSFLDASVGAIFREHRGWGKVRLMRMYNLTKEILSESFVKYMAADTTGEIDSTQVLSLDTIHDTAKTAISAMVRDLKECGFDYFLEEKKTPYRDRYNDTWHPKNEREIHEIKKGWVDRTQLVINVYMLTALKYARDECEYGAKRLTELYRLMKKDLNTFLDAFLDPSLKGYRNATALVKQRQNILIEAGISLTELDIKNGVEG